VPPARNKAGRAAKGESRHEGNQTLKTEHSGPVKPANVDLRRLMCCRETKPMRGAAHASAATARVRSAILRMEAKPGESGGLNT